MARKPKMPLRRTLSMQSFSDNPSRDRFHVWLAHRGAPVLTQHLLAMVMIGPDDAEGGVAPGRARRLL